MALAGQDRFQIASFAFEDFNTVLPDQFAYIVEILGLLVFIDIDFKDLSFFILQCRFDGDGSLDDHR